MKISFSTLGCPDWHWQEIAATAADLGYDAVEIRGIYKDIFAPDSPVFAEDSIDAVKAKLAGNGLEISCIDTTAVLLGKNTMAATVETAKLAEKLGCKYIRVLGDAAPEPSDVDIEKAVSEMKSLCKAVAPYGVSIIIETNGVFANTRVLADFIEAVGEENIGVLWDIQHPYRIAGESVSETVANIGKKTVHVHIKDSVTENGKPVYKMTGYGDLPIKEAIAELKKIGFDGCLSLEWLKRWNKELEDPGIVFAHYIRTIKTMM